MQFNLFSLTLIIVCVLYLTLGFLAIPFFKKQNNFATKLWVFSTFLSAIGSIVISIRLADLDGSMEMLGVDRVLIIGQFIRFLGGLGMLVFLRLLVKHAIWHSYKEALFFLTVFLGGAILSIGKIFFPSYIPNLVIQIFLILYIGWFIYIIMQLKKIPENENTLLQIISVILYLLIGVAILDLSINFITKIFVAKYFIGTPIYIFIQEAFLPMRALGNVMAFIIGFIFWVQNYSDLAEKIKLNNLRISLLLEEKDTLITKLNNQKMLLESGGLAVGLAHELNQHLGSIRLNVEQVLYANQSRLETPMIKNSLERVLSANEQAAAIIRNLKKLFSNSLEKSESMQLDVLVGEVVDLYQDRLEKSHIDVELKLTSVGSVSINGSLIRQVLVNLISNSIDSLDSINQVSKRITITLIESPQSIILDFCDNGPGVLKSNVTSLFHLFQTTKPSGSGIGLWLSKHIVESLGGQLMAHSVAPGNVTFRVQFPVDKS